MKKLIIILIIAVTMGLAISYTPLIDKLPPITGPPDAQAWGGGLMIWSGPVTTPTGDSGGCPSWGPSYYLAWDGEYPSGNTYACLDSGNGTVNGTNTNGTFGADGADTIWISDADGDNLKWLVDSGDIQHDNAVGVTVCMQVRMANVVANAHIWEFIGDADDYIRGMTRSAEVVRFYLETGTTSDSMTSSSTFTDDGTTWNDLCFSWDQDGSPDISVRVNTAGSTANAWEDVDTQPATWTDGVETSFLIGSDAASGQNTETDFKYLVVIPTYKADVPW